MSSFRWSHFSNFEEHFSLDDINQVLFNLFLFPRENSGQDPKKARYSLAQIEEKKQVEKALVNVVKSKVLAKLGKWDHPKLGNTVDFDQHYLVVGAFLRWIHFCILGLNWYEIVFQEVLYLKQLKTLGSQTQ
jgi:hypothetical protein